MLRSFDNAEIYAGGDAERVMGQAIKVGLALPASVQPLITICWTRRKSSGKFKDCELGTVQLHMQLRRRSAASASTSTTFLRHEIAIVALCMTHWCQSAESYALLQVHMHRQIENLCTTRPSWVLCMVDGKLPLLQL